MKYLLLAGTLGALMLLPFVIANTPNAYANMFLIDNFTDDNPPGDDPALNGLCDLTITNAPSSSTFLEHSATAGGVDFTEVIMGSGTDPSRGCQLVNLSLNPPSSAAMNVAETKGMFRQMSGTGVASKVLLWYDGEDDNSNAGSRTLSLDLSESDGWKIQYSKSDFQVNVTATMYDGSGNAASQEGIFEAGTASLKTLFFPLSDFEIDNPALDLTDIDAFNVTLITDTDAVDYDIENIMITMQPVGGEMMPADTTALLLAGAELNAIWILPAITAIGISAFIVVKKRN